MTGAMTGAMTEGMTGPIAAAAGIGRDAALAAIRTARAARSPAAPAWMPADPEAAAPDAWLRHRKLVDGVAPHYPGGAVAVDTLVSRIDATAEAFLMEALSWSTGRRHDPEAVPPVRLLRVSAGAGKSRRVIDALAGSAGLLTGRTIYYLTPSHPLAAEIAAYARARLGGRLPVRHIKGRTYRDPDRPEHDPTPCRKAAIVGEAMQAGVRDVYGSFCAHQDPATGAWRDCPFKATCLEDGYLGQLANPGPGLYLLTHQVLTQTPPRRLPEPDLVIVDEDCLDVFPAPGTTPVDRLLAHARDRPWVAAVVAALEAEHPKAALQAADITPERCRNAATHHGRLGASARPAIYPDEPESVQRGKLDRLRACDHHRIAAFWRLLAEELEQPWAHLQRLRRVADAPTRDGLRTVVRRYGCRALSPILARSPVLLLDATAEPDLYRLVWPQLQVTSARARRNARIIGVYDTTNSRHRTLAGPAAGRNRRRLNVIIQRLAARHESLAVFSYRALLEELDPLPANVTAAHFGALRGLDALREYDAAVVIGRNELSVEDAEATARCLAGAAGPLTLVAADGDGRKGYPRQVRGFRLASPRHAKGVPVAVHPDALVQRVVERAREREMEQAIDRLRLIHRRTPATVYLLSSLPVDVTYDALVPEAALLPTRLEQALTTLCRTDGLLDLNRDRLPHQRPDLWASAAAARQDLHRCLRVADGGEGRTYGERDDAGAFGLEPPAEADGGIGLSALIRDLITANRLILAAYRVAGRGGARASLVAIDPLFVVDPRQAVERYVRRAYDANLAAFEVLLGPDDRDQVDDWPAAVGSGGDDPEAAAERLAVRLEPFPDLTPDDLALIEALTVPAGLVAPGLGVTPMPWSWGGTIGRPGVRSGGLGHDTS